MTDRRQRAECSICSTVRLVDHENIKLPVRHKVLLLDIFPEKSLNSTVSTKTGFNSDCQSGPELFTDMEICSGAFVTGIPVTDTNQVSLFSCQSSSIWSFFSFRSCCSPRHRPLPATVTSEIRESSPAARWVICTSRWQSVHFKP